MLRGESFICFAGEDWWYHHPHSKNHIMKRLARAGNKVVFVNSISMGLPGLDSPDLFRKIRRKLRSYTKMVRRTAEGIIVVSPISVPLYGRFWDRLNRFLLATQIRLLMIAFEMRDPILWIAIPTALPVLGHLGEQCVIYQVSDKYEANQMDHATPREMIRSMHLRLQDRADIIYYSGRKLYEEAMAAHPEHKARSKLLEQAVEFEHFSLATDAAFVSDTSRIPPDISPIPSPKLGYFGALDPWLLDQELVRYVSARRPDWQWVFIGLRASPLSVESLPNVHYLGSKPYSTMPAYAARFDVCVLPWVTGNEFVHYGSAIKVREYLATGKPVVITPLYEYEPLDGILRIARSYDDFIAKVEDALNRDNEIQARARQDAVRSSTWDARTETVSRDVASRINGTRAIRATLAESVNESKNAVPRGIVDDFSDPDP